jgi:hypothetical protein
MSMRGSHASYAANLHKQRMAPDDWNHKESTSHQKDTPMWKGTTRKQMEISGTGQWGVHTTTIDKA